MENQKVKEDDLMNRQKAFIKETAEKISIDEDAVNELRMGSISDDISSNSFLGKNI